LPPRFLLSGGEVDGIWNNGRMSVKFRVETTATTDGQKAAVVAALNDWWQTRG
jgi:hypothetical protein